MHGCGLTMSTQLAGDSFSEAGLLLEGDELRLLCLLLISMVTASVTRGVASAGKPPNEMFNPLKAVAKSSTSSLLPPLTSDSPEALTSEFPSAPSAFKHFFSTDEPVSTSSASPCDFSFVGVAGWDVSADSALLLSTDVRVDSPRNEGRGVSVGVTLGNGLANTILLSSCPIPTCQSYDHQ